MKLKKYLNTLSYLTLVVFVFPFFSLTQVEEEEEEEDYSMYEDYDSDESEKRYCTPKVKGLSPAKLISIGYDFAGPHQIKAGTIGNEVGSVTERASNYHGLRLSVNLPVLSNNRILINVGANYQEARYNFKNSELDHPFHKSLDGNIRSTGLNTTLFKPLNETHYVLGYYMAEYSGDYSASNLQPLSFVKHTWLGVFGWKFNDRFQLGFGATQSYRAGEVNYFPILMYNYTARQGNWGIEMLAPARAHFRYRFSPRSLILVGMDLEGTSFHLSNRDNLYPATGTEGIVPDYNADLLELRRSEIRLNIKYEKALTDFLWVSAQAGYALNYRSDVDSDEFFRGFFRDIPYVMENEVGGVPYVQVSLSLVSP